jgi:O-antigen ligase
MSLSALGAVDQEQARWLVDLTGKVVVPCFVASTLVDSVAKLKQLIWTIVLSQAFVAWDFNQSYFSGYNKLWLDGFGGMDNNCNAIALVTCLGPAVLLGMEDRLWWRKGIMAVSAILMLHAILFSFSRGGMLATIIAFLMILVLMPKRPQNIVVFALAVIFQKRPVMGAGPRNWPRLAKYEYGWGTGKEAHNVWLQTGAELGFPGMGLLMAFYGLTIARLLPMTRETFRVPEPWFHEGARIVIVSIVGFTVSATFVSLQTLETPFYIAILGAGLLKLSSASTNRQDGEDPQGSPEHENPWPPLLATSQFPS